MKLYERTALIFYLCLVTFSCKDSTISTLSPNTTFIISVGISDYQQNDKSFLDLSYSDDDAQKISEFFKSKERHNNEKVQGILLLNEQATKENILLTAKKLFAKAKKEDKVIFYFSGHGINENLIPYNALADNFLQYQELRGLFRSTKASTKLCIIDACNSGGLKFNSKNTKNASYANGDSSEDEIIVMVSSKLFQKSMELEKLKQGIFSFFLIEGLKGKANLNDDEIIDISELHQYIYANVRKFTNNQQIPETFGRFNKNSPIIYLN